MRPIKLSALGNDLGDMGLRASRKLRMIVANGPRCPDCGGPLVFGEGYRVCPICGHSGWR